MKRLICFLALIIMPFALPATGYRFVVIPVEFSDISFKDKNAAVNDKISSATSYFNHQFSPVRTFTFDVLPCIKLSKPCSWYGANSSTLKDANIGNLVREAVGRSNADFSVYDNDSDGKIDNIYIIAAGNNEAMGHGADCIWPQQAFLSQRGESFQADGRTVDSFTICTEDSSVGVFCHELCHVFGLQDMYDTDGSGSGGTSIGLWGRLSPMDMSCFNDSASLPPNFSAVELEQLGLGSKIPYTRGPVQLRPVSQYKEYFRIDTDTDGEYYLLECRKAEGWDSNLGGGGLVIYHIDKSDSDSWYSDLYRRNLTARERWDLNQINCRPDRSCAQVISATPGADDISKVFYPQEGRRTFGSDTDPAFRFWNGNTSTVAIDEITLQPDGSVSFNVIAPISIITTHVFQDAIIVNWQTSPSLKADRCYVSWYAGGHLIGTSVSSSQSDDKFFSIIEGLEPSTEYVIRIRAVAESGQTFSSTAKLSTKGRQKGVRPFIYLNSLSRREDGSFYAGDKVPMRIYNLAEEAKVLWYFDNMLIRPESDGYWQLTRSGTLSAEIWYNDGSVEIITRQMEVR